MSDRKPLTLFSYLTYRNVFVEMGDGTLVYGKLIDYSLPSRKSERRHRPFILILDSPIGRNIIRGEWTAIGTKERFT